MPPKIVELRIKITIIDKLKNHVKYKNSERTDLFTLIVVSCITPCHIE